MSVATHGKCKGSRDVQRPTSRMKSPQKSFADDDALGAMDGLHLLLLSRLLTSLVFLLSIS